MDSYMEGHHHHHQQQQHHYHHLQHHQQQQQQGHNPPQQQQSIIAAVNVEASDRFPQWSLQESKEFLMIRAELDQTFIETKRNKLLWEVIAKKMREKGFNRSAEQCKCKWKNLVTRYKGCKIMEPETVRQQFPFYDDMQAIFTGRIQRMLSAEAEGGGTSASKKKAASHLSSDEEDEHEESEELVGEINQKGNIKKINPKKRKSNIPGGSSISSSSSSGINLRDLLEEFMKQQLRMEREWREAWEAREKVRAAREMEWQRKMEELESERVVMERMWREREEQRRVREEARTEKRDHLINVLLNKLTREGSI